VDQEIHAILELLLVLHLPSGLVHLVIPESRVLQQLLVVLVVLVIPVILVHLVVLVVLLALVDRLDFDLHEILKIIHECWST
jgi:hypothetical protein